MKSRRAATVSARFDRFLVQISDASTPLPDGTSRR
jgi:hypothetical protein